MIFTAIPRLRQHKKPQPKPGREFVNKLNQIISAVSPRLQQYGSPVTQDNPDRNACSFTGILRSRSAMKVRLGLPTADAFPSPGRTAAAGYHCLILTTP